MTSNDYSAMEPVWGTLNATPLTSLQRLSEHLNVESVYLKDEGRRKLGSFKSLGGMYAALFALARSSGCDSVSSFLSEDLERASLPKLICASDGNHGLAIAAAAKWVGTSARIYLHEDVSAMRAQRIQALGADISWVKGTYDDAVNAACLRSESGEGLLVSDTSENEYDLGVGDVMTGYGVIGFEILNQLDALHQAHPTHLFVQAGVGGLAAALAKTINHGDGFHTKTVVVEPENVACVNAGLQAGSPVVLNNLKPTCAAMLSCGTASFPALAELLLQDASGITVTEDEIEAAIVQLQNFGGPSTTPSGVTSFAGLLRASRCPDTREMLDLNSQSRIAFIVTEAQHPDC